MRCEGRPGVLELSKEGEQRGGRPLFFTEPPACRHRRGQRESAPSGAPPPKESTARLCHAELLAASPAFSWAWLSVRPVLRKRRFWRHKGNRRPIEPGYPLPLCCSTRTALLEDQRVTPLHKVRSFKSLVMLDLLSNFRATGQVAGRESLRQVRSGTKAPWTGGQGGPHLIKLGALPADREAWLGVAQIEPSRAYRGPT